MREKFDSVKFQRKVREELGKRYSTNREAFLRKLKRSIVSKGIPHMHIGRRSKKEISL